MKTILITGGAGFIGSHLSKRLLAGKNRIICLDNLITGSQKNIADLLQNDQFFFVNQDACKAFSSRKFDKIDEIYHFASPADPNINSDFSYMNHPFETMKVNTVGTWNMCELALKHNAKLLFASTSEVYGDPKVTPQDEEYLGNVSTTGPRAVYDEAKRFGETIVSAYVREKKLDGKISRIFNTYGPNMNPNEGRAVVNFIGQAISDDPLTIYGDGKQTRSFCYIDDQVEGQIAVMEEGRTGEVYNVGNPDERTIMEFANLIKNLAKSNSKIIFEPLPEHDPMQRRPDITKIKNELGWKPRVKLNEGLMKTISYFRERLVT